MNKYHDENGRFCSREEMGQAITRLATKGDVQGYLKLKEQYEEISKRTPDEFIATVTASTPTAGKPIATTAAPVSTGRDYADHEQNIADLFAKEKQVTINGVEYETILSTKPTYAGGEGKTDVYVQLRNKQTGDIEEIKISLKLPNADFVENKISSTRAQAIFGDDYAHRLQTSLKPALDRLEGKNPEVPGKTKLIGYRVDIVNKEGASNFPVELSKEELVDLYAGTTLDDKKKNPVVSGKQIPGAGVASHILVGKSFGSAQEIIDNMQPIDEYVDSHPNLYITLRAVNLRPLGKYEKGRALALYYEWSKDADGNDKWDVKLDPTLKETSSTVGRRMVEKGITV